MLTDEPNCEVVGVVCWHKICLHASWVLYLSQYWSRSETPYRRCPRPSFQASCLKWIKTFYCSVTVNLAVVKLFSDLKPKLRHTSEEHSVTRGVAFGRGHLVLYVSKDCFGDFIKSLGTILQRNGKCFTRQPTNSYHKRSCVLWKKRDYIKSIFWNVEFAYLVLKVVLAQVSGFCGSSVSMG